MFASRIALSFIAVAAERAPALPVVVTGDSRCPQPAEVAARVGRLLPRSPVPGAVAYTAEVRDGGVELAIVLRGAGGSVANERRLPRQYSCDELAAAAAAVIAAWLSDIHPEFARPEPTVRSADPAAPVLESSQPAKAAPSVPARPPPLDATRAPAAAQGPVVATTSGAAAPAVREGTALSLRLDGAAGLAATLGPSGGSPGWAAGALVAAGLRWAPTRLGARLALTAGTARVFPLGMGQLHVTRTSLSVGPTFRLTREEAPLSVDLAAFLVGSRLVTRGSGFPRASAIAGLDGGGGGSVRVGLRRAWSPFLELGASAWPVARAGLERVDGNTRPLPQVEVGLTCGILFTGGAGPVRPAALGPRRQ
jgi:hypothetical protein